MNGKNLKFKAYLPFASIEIIAFILTVYSYCYIDTNLPMSLPLYYASHRDFFTPNSNKINTPFTVGNTMQDPSNSTSNNTVPIPAGEDCRLDLNGNAGVGCKHIPSRHSKYTDSFFGGSRDKKAHSLLGAANVQSGLFQQLDYHKLAGIYAQCKKLDHTTKTVNGQKLFDEDQFKTALKGGALKSWTDDFMSRELDVYDAISQTWKKTTFSNERKPEGSAANSRKIEDAVKDPCDFITISNNCVCSGVFPMDSKILSLCPSSMGSNSVYLKKGDVPAGGWYRKERDYIIPNGDAWVAENNPEWANVCEEIDGGLGGGLDTSGLELNYWNQKKMFAFLAMIISGSRMCAMLAHVIGKYKKTSICQNELRKPGAQWINGWWAGVACLVARYYCGLFYDYVTIRERHDTQKVQDPESFANPVRKIDYKEEYFTKQWLVNGYDKHTRWARLYPFDHLNKARTDQAMVLLMYAAIANILCSFISEQSYCTDCTGYAYTQDNLDRVRKRDIILASHMSQTSKVVEA